MENEENFEIDEVEVNPIESMIDSILGNDYKASSDIFNDMISDKMNDALEDKKVAMADTVFNGGSDDLEISDEEIEEFFDEEDIQD
jgi:hypothetical protein